MKEEPQDEYNDVDDEFGNSNNKKNNLLSRKSSRASKPTTIETDDNNNNNAPPQTTFQTPVNVNTNTSNTTISSSSSAATATTTTVKRPSSNRTLKTVQQDPSTSKLMESSARRCVCGTELTNAGCTKQCCHVCCSMMTDDDRWCLIHSGPTARHIILQKRRTDSDYNAPKDYTTKARIPTTTTTTSTTTTMDDSAMIANSAAAVASILTNNPIPEGPIGRITGRYYVDSTQRYVCVCGSEWPTQKSFAG